MKKIVIHCLTSQVGTDSWEFFEVPDDMTENELNELAETCAQQNAEMYGIYSPSDSYDEYDNGEPVEDDEADDNIEGYWMVYDPELHDGHSMGGIPDWVKL